MEPSQAQHAVATSFATDGELVRDGSGAPRRVVLVVSGHDIDVSGLAARLAWVVGRRASVTCWAADAEAEAADLPTHAAPTPPQGAREYVSVVVASSRPGLVGSLHAQLARLPGTRVLDPVGDPARLLSSLQERLPRLLLLDEALLDRLAPRTLAAIPMRAPGVRVLLLCPALRPGLVERARCHGFHGCLVLGAAPQVWARAVAAVARGEQWFPAALPAPDVPAESGDGGTLTPREAEIVANLREGLSNKEIAGRLGIREDTVKKHLQSVFAKLGVHRRALLALGRVPARPSLS